MGDIICGICREKIKREPIKKNFGEKFMSYQYLFDSDYICERCYERLKNNWFRYHSWYETKDMLFPKELKKDEVIKFLLNPPEKPFRAYLTKKKRKHGWILVMPYWETNRDVYRVAFEEEIVWVDRKEMREMVKFAKEMLEKGIKKREMLRGEIGWNSMKKIGEKYHEVSDKIKKLAGNPLWRMVMAWM